MIAACQRNSVVFKAEKLQHIFHRKFFPKFVNVTLYSMKLDVVALIFVWKWRAEHSVLYLSYPAAILYTVLVTVCIGTVYHFLLPV